MSEQDLRDGLHTAVLDEPPLSFDPDAVIATAQQQIRRRRALVSAGVATVLVAAAAVAVPVAINQSGRGHQVADQPTVSSWPPENPKPPSYTAVELSQLATQMQGHLDGQLRMLIPNATDIRVEQFGGEATGDFSDGQNYLNTFATFAIDRYRYGIGINIYAPGSDAQTPDELCATTYCAALDDVAGGQVLAKDENLNGGQLRMVYHFRATGTQVSAGAYNYDPTGRTPLQYAPDIPITDDQLARLATDQALNL